MTKQEIKKAKDNELIVDYVQTVSLRDSNYVLGRGTERADKHAHDLEIELVNRGLLTEDDVRLLNM